VSIHEPVNDTRTYAGISLEELHASFPTIVRQLRDYARMSFEQSLIAQGYEPKGPAVWSRFGGRNVDADALTRCTCTVCGQRGLEYRPWSKPGSYRAIARCTACNDWSEY